jgi:hypothetical protein
MSRVIIQLAGGQYISHATTSREKAIELVEAWVSRCKHRIENGQVNDVETTIVTWGSALPGEEGRTVTASMMQYIIGMYIPEETPPCSGCEKLAKAQERIAKVLERESRKGNEWRSDEE